MAQVTFDGSNKLIIVNYGVTAIDVKEVYSEWKIWVMASDNAKYLQAFRNVGGDPLPGSKALGATYFLLNGWRIRPYEGNHTLNVNGNLYCEDGSSPFVSTIGAWSVFVISSVSSLVDSTIQQLPEIEQGMFQNQVCIDPINGSSVSAYPAGTRQNPVKTLAIAKAIAAGRGFTEFFIFNTLTVSATETISGYTLVGTGVENSYTVLVSGCNTAKTTFKELTVSGRQNGETHYHDCEIGNLSNVHCEFIRCRLIGPMAMHPSYADTTVLHQCYSGDEGGLPTTVDMNNSPVNMSFNDWSGNLQIINLNKPTAGIITVNGVAGELFIDSTCVTGTIKIHGSMEVTDTSTGTIIENDSVIKAVSNMISNISITGAGLTTIEHNQLMALQNVDVAALVDANWNKVMPGQTVTMAEYILKKLLTTNKYIGLS